MGPLVFHWRGFMSLLLFPSPKRISASLLSQPMRPTTCSYKKGTWNGQCECLNRRGIAFGDCRDLYGRPFCLTGERRTEPMTPTYTPGTQVDHYEIIRML